MAGAGDTHDQERARVFGQRIYWEQAIPATNPVRYDIYMRDLATGTPTQLTDGITDGNSYTQVAPFGDLAVWTANMAADQDIMLLYNHFTLTVGDSVNPSWSHLGPFSLADRAPNLFGDINAYLGEQNTAAEVHVPITIHSDTGSIANPTVVHIDNIGVTIGFITDPMNRDTDSDGLIDGNEVFNFFGEHVKEIEDAISYHEWRPAFMDIAGVKMEQTNFMHQTGVTMTSSYNMYGLNGAVSPDYYRDSWLKLQDTFGATGTYRLKVRPNTIVNSIQYTIYVPQGTSDVRYTPVTISGTNIPCNDKVSALVTSILQDAFYFQVTRDGGQEVKPLSGSYSVYAYVEKIELGYSKGMDAYHQKARVSIELGLTGDYELEANTQYQITMGLDLSRVPVDEITQLSTADYGFSELTWLEILDLDYMRVERSGLNPLNPDTDNDGLLDNQEATDTGFPLSNDADRDGLSDYQEMVIYHTDPMRRDSDNDGIRDGVELGMLQMPVDVNGVRLPCLYENKCLEGVQFSPGSWNERVAHSNDNPFDYTPIDNWDADPPNWALNVPADIKADIKAHTTDPLNPDTDNDGLPDGWIDGWTYGAGPVKKANLQSYATSNLQLQDVHYWRYDPTKWYQSGQIDNEVQVFEGEDLNLDGDSGQACALNNHCTSWDFYSDTLIRKSSDGNANDMLTTDPTNPDSDFDGIPDGYEAWYSTIAPQRAKVILDLPLENQPLIISPLNSFDAGQDNDLIADGHLTITDGVGVLADSIPCPIGVDDAPSARAMLIDVSGDSNIVDQGTGEIINPVLGVQLYLDLTNMQQYSVAVDVWESNTFMYQLSADLPPIPGTTIPIDREALKPLNKDPIIIPGGRKGWTDVKFDSLMIVPEGDGSNGMYIPTYFTEFFIVVSAVPSDPTSANPTPTFSWYGTYSTMQSSYYMDPMSLSGWTEYNNVALSYKLLTVLPQNNWGDGLTNLQEYIVGTNPKNSNTDSITIGSSVEGAKNSINEDYLTDGVEVGYLYHQDTPTWSLDPGAVIFRTNIQDGAISTSHYDENMNNPDAYINYDGDGSGNTVTGVQFRFPSTGNNNNVYPYGIKKIVDPPVTDPSVSPDNIKILSLEDGSEIYVSYPYDFTWSNPTNPLGDIMFVWTGQLNRDNTYIDSQGIKRVVGTVYILTKHIDCDMTAYTIDQTDAKGNYYTTRQLYLSDPFKIDTDSDGVVDGLEVTTNNGQWDSTGWKQNAEFIAHANGYGDVPPDPLINVRDPDSDNDGLLDSQEIAPMEAGPSTVGKAVKLANMANPDSDGDGVLDGKEVKYSEDTSGTGIVAGTQVTYDINGNEVDYKYNDKVNMLNPDSDGDGVIDSAEVAPYVAYKNFGGPDPNHPIAPGDSLTIRPAILDNLNSPTALTTDQSGNIYYADGTKVMELKAGFDKFVRDDGPTNSAVQLLDINDNSQNALIKDAGDIKNLTVTKDYVYVLERTSHIDQIRLIDNAGRSIDVHTTDNPWTTLAIAVDSSGYVYYASNDDTHQIGTIVRLEFPQNMQDNVITTTILRSSSIYPIKGFAVSNNGDLVFSDTNADNPGLKILKAPFSLSGKDEDITKNNANVHILYKASNIGIVNVDASGNIIFDIVVAGDADKIMELTADYSLTNYCTNNFLVSRINGVTILVKEQEVDGIAIDGQGNLYVLEYQDGSHEQRYRWGWVDRWI